MLLAAIEIFPLDTGDISKLIQQHLLRNGFFGKDIGDLDKKPAITGHFPPVKIFDISAVIALIAVDSVFCFTGLPVL